MKKFKNYAIDFRGDSFDIIINDLVWFSLPIVSAIETNEMKDFENEVISFEVFEEENRIEARWFSSSSNWQEKVYTVTADDSGFYYQIKIKGNGTISKIKYFTGDIQYEVAGYLLPVATHKNRNDCTYNIYEDNELALGYFGPPPFVFPFFVEDEKGWFGLGLISKAGEYNYDRFIYRKNFELELPLYNRTVVDGEWETHGIWGGYGEDALDVIHAYSNWHFDNGFCEKHFDYNKSPRWWKGPIFCGHGEQQILQSHAGLLNHRSFANQEEYTKMYYMLREKGLKPSFIIVDSLWQESLGNLVVDKKKWPDFRGFVEMLHEDNIRVVLWIRSFHSHGIPFDECILKGWIPLSADPSNPAFRERTRNAIRTLISDEEGCYNCDGFKIDYINCIPEGEQIQTYEKGIYGVELIKRWIQLVHDSAKAVKEDALINVSCAHPYLAKESDQIRIHDYHSEMRSVCSVMGYRKEVADAVYPGVLIDCDSGGRMSRRDFIRYMKFQSKIGIPCLYHISKSENGSCFANEEDYEIIRNEWDNYIKKIEG